TDSGFVKLYGLKLQQGKFPEKDFEITIGADVARLKNLRIGDKIQGAHGLTIEGETHDEHSYIVSGILTRQNNVSDHLLLTNIQSVWKMHGLEEEHDTEEEHHDEQEITALLIQYRSPMSVVLFPRLVNQSTNMQAASPATESVRLFSLIGIGVDTLQWFALLIMLIAAISVFVSIYNSLKERRYDLAIMRTIGASRAKLFDIIIFEGSILTLLGSLLGIFMAHLALEFIGSFQDAEQAKLTGLMFLFSELYILLAGVAIGVLATVIPAIQVYKYNISQILSKS
ncbi:MAG TPA: FtsX-like permease family protein, partial [Pedobacter sp.]|nr:FtsX-like permease family protein [Pedobacter sp.]